MKPKFKKYTLKKGDTLKSISIILEKSSHEVKNFHNIFCESDEYIGIEFPKNLLELYIYPEYNEKELSLIPKVTFEKPFELALKPLQNKVNYGVMYTITSGEEVNTIKFETSVLFKGITESKEYIFEIDRISKTFVNDEETSTIADELAEKTSKVLYPLELIVAKDGKWSGINNYKEIKKRWEKVKEKIHDEYEGEWVEKYLLLNEQTLEEEGNVVNALKKDWFLSSFFNGIYVYYTPKFIFENNITFPILTSCEAINYKVNQKISEFLDESNLIKIEQNGIVVEERSKSDLRNESSIAYYGALYPNEDMAEGNFRSLYFLNGKTNTIESLFIECSIQLEIEKKVQVVVSLL